jgi:hypothetical protein
MDGRMVLQIHFHPEIPVLQEFMVIGSNLYDIDSGSSLWHKQAPTRKVMGASDCLFSVYNFMASLSNLKAIAQSSDACECEMVMA